MAKQERDGWRGSPDYWEKLVEIYRARLRERRRSYLYVPLAEALYKLGRADEAIETIEDGLALLPGSRAAMILLARIYFEKGDMAAAKPILRRVTAKWPDVPSAVSMLCEIYEREGDIQSACGLALSLRDYFPDSDEVAELIGRYGAATPEPDRDGQPGQGPLDMGIVIGPGMLDGLVTDSAQEAGAAAGPAEEEGVDESSLFLPFNEGGEPEQSPPPESYSLPEIEVFAEPAGEEQADGGHDDDVLFKLESILARIYHLKSLNDK